MQQIEARRRQDRHASQQRALLASRAAVLDTEDGCESILVHLSRAGVVSRKMSKSLHLFLDTLEPQQQLKARAAVEQPARLLKQMSDARDAAASVQQGQPSSSSMAEAQGAGFDVPEPYGMPDSVPLVRSRPAVPSTSGSHAPAQCRPRSMQSRPAPSITDMCNSVIAGKLPYSRDQLRAFLANLQYPEPLQSDASLDSLRNRVVAVTKAQEGMAGALRLLQSPTSIAMPMLVNLFFSADAEYNAAVAAREVPGQDPVQPSLGHRV